jgi:hypothetical protein
LKRATKGGIWVESVFLLGNLNVFGLARRNERLRQNSRNGLNFLAASERAERKRFFIQMPLRFTNYPLAFGSVSLKKRMESRFFAGNSRRMRKYKSIQGQVHGR